LRIRLFLFVIQSDDDWARYWTTGSSSNWSLGGGTSNDDRCGSGARTELNLLIFDFGIVVFDVAVNERAKVGESLLLFSDGDGCLSRRSGGRSFSDCGGDWSSGCGSSTNARLGN
jgi:hypothetical protein